MVCAVAVAAVSFGGTLLSPPEGRAAVRNTGWAMTVAAGIAGLPPRDAGATDSKTDPADNSGSQIPV